MVSATQPVALINALYQDNPQDWRRYLDKFALISPRDSWSAATLAAWADGGDSPIDAPRRTTSGLGHLVAESADG